MENDIKITLTDADANNIRISVTDTNDVSVSTKERLVLKYVEPDHSKLDNLDYEHSNHTGFMPKKLSLLPKLQNGVKNNRLSLVGYDKDSEESYEIDFDDVRKRIIKTTDVRSLNDQKGQYIFLEINKEES